MQKIPRFDHTELQAIAELLSSEGIRFDCEGVSCGLSPYHLHTEYYVKVSDEDFAATLALLIEYFQIQDETTTPFEGTCPACGSEVPGALECPDCGLSFAFGTPPAVKTHPFYIYLKENALLPF